jgi:glutathione S-transferase
VSIPHRPKWFNAIGAGKVPVLQFPEGIKYSESLAIMELLNDLYETQNDENLFPLDVMTKGRYREFISIGSSIGDFMFRSILTQNKQKREQDLTFLKKLLMKLEENLMISKTVFFFSRDLPSLVDFYFIPHVLRLVYLHESS